MMDPRQLYTLDEAVVAKLKEHRPVLIHQLDGFVDAGQAGRLFSAHLLEQLDHEVLAEFDHDQLHDYRSRRPAMVFDTNPWTSYAELHLRIYRSSTSRARSSCCSAARSRTCSGSGWLPP